MDIINLVRQFRDALDEARKAGAFDDDISFNSFPRGCCGDASDLLAQYLLSRGVRTYYVCGTYRDRSAERILTHAWLQTESHIIIDITGDQFRDDPDFLYYEKPVYIGAEDHFHRLFQVDERDVHENTGLDSKGDLCQLRLKGLYRNILKHIPKKQKQSD